jgi:hypothetical protein
MPLFANKKLIAKKAKANIEGGPTRPSRRLGWGGGGALRNLIKYNLISKVIKLSMKSINKIENDFV